mgnify:CR=1 FL=1
MSYDNWKLASPPENDLVSPCCGSSYDEIHVAEDLAYLCDKCKDTFDEPEEEYEYNERMRENAAEDRMDEERLGL